MKEALGSELCKMVSINDAWNIADLFTKFHSMTSSKMQYLNELLRKGMFRAPIEAFSGRTKLATKEVFQKKLENYGKKGNIEGAAAEVYASSQEGEKKRVSFKEKAEIKWIPAKGSGEQR